MHKYVSLSIMYEATQHHPQWQTCRSLSSFRLRQKTNLSLFILTHAHIVK